MERKKTKKALILLLFLSFLIQFSFLNVVYAETEPVDISDFPQRLALALNIPLFAGQLIASGLIMSFFLFPTFVLTKGKDMMAVLFVGFISMSICVALTWLPYWILLIVSLIVAAMWSNKIKDWLGR